MGQKQHSYEDDYSDNKYSEEKEDNNEKENKNDKDSDNNNNNEEDDNNSEEYYSYDNIIKNLNHMNLTEQKVKDNYEFYKLNYEKLIKINKIITNVKIANLYNITPFEMLAKLVPEEELKNLPPEYDTSDNKKEIFNEAPINPEYVVPSKWEGLFDLEISDKVIDKLYIALQIKKIAKFYSQWKRGKYEIWEKKIHEYDYKIYESEMKTFINSQKNDILEKLNLMNLSEQDIEDNFWFYKNNLKKLVKINEMINNIESSNFNDLSPQEVLAKIVPENELKNINSANVPTEWKDLFKLETSDEVLDYLYIESKILMLVTEFSSLKNENIDKWLSLIDINNYQKYEEELEEKKQKELSHKNILNQLKSLEYFNKTEEEIKRYNIDFLCDNLERLIKTDNTIKTAKIGNLYYLTPGEAYRKVTGDSPDHLKLPKRWEDLFDLTIPESKIDILYATTKNYIKNKEFEKNRIESNLADEKNHLALEFQERNDNNNKIIDKNNLIEELKKLRYFKVKEKEIKKNIEYYLDNFEEIKKIDTIIKYAKKAKVYDKTPEDFIKEERGTDYSFPKKWEDLFKLDNEKWKIDMLYNSLAKKIESKNQRKAQIREKKWTTIDELKKLKYFEFKESKIKENIGFYIDHLDEFKKIDEILIMGHEVYNIRNSTPMEIYKKSYVIDGDISFPKKWTNLFKLNWTTNKLNELYIATKIEKLKYYLSEFKLESYLDYKYYDSNIRVDNYKYYEEEFNKYFENYKRLRKMEENVSYISSYIDEFYSGNDKKTIKDHIEYLKEKNLNAKSDLDRFDIYEQEFERVNSQIVKKRDEYWEEKKRIWREEEREREEEERRERRQRERERENGNYSSNYNSSSSSNNSDFKKSYVKLCRYCKNKCLYCKSDNKGSSKAFGLHNKCQTDSCFICGTSKRSDDIMERQSSYLCKSCYNSHKLDFTKCLSCQKGFK